MSLDTEIEALESMLMRLKDIKAHQSEALKEAEKWQPKGGDWFGFSGGVTTLPSSSAGKKFGLERENERQAERAAVEMRRFNRLLALRDELCGGDVVDWRNEDQDKWCLYFDNTIKVWSYACRQNLQYITPYFTTKELAIKACDMLNSGEVEL